MFPNSLFFSVPSKEFDWIFSSAFVEVMKKAEVTRRKRLLIEKNFMMFGLLTLLNRERRKGQRGSTLVLVLVLLMPLDDEKENDDIDGGF